MQVRYDKTYMNTRVSSQALTAQSSVIVAPKAQWPDIVKEIRATVHAADFREIGSFDAPPSVQEIRHGALYVQLTPVGRQKVALLYNADLFSKEVANALLKTIEEPAQGVHIVLFAETDRLLPTIRSRVQLLATRVKPDDGTLWETILQTGSTGSEAERDKARQTIVWHALWHSGISPATIQETLADK